MSMNADLLGRYRSAYTHSARETKREILHEVCRRTGWSTAYARKKILYPGGSTDPRAESVQFQRIVALWQMFGCPSIDAMRLWVEHLAADPRSRDSLQSDLSESLELLSHISDSTLHRRLTELKRRRAVNPRDIALEMDTGANSVRGKVSFAIRRHLGAPSARGAGGVYTVFFQDLSSGLSKARTLAVTDVHQLAAYLRQAAANAVFVDNLITVQSEPDLRETLSPLLAAGDRAIRFTANAGLGPLIDDYSALVNFVHKRHRSELFLLNLLWDEYDRLRNIFFPRYRIRMEALRGGLPSAASAVFIIEQLTRVLPDQMAKRKFYDYSKADGFQLLDRVGDLQKKIMGETSFRLASTSSSVNEYAIWKKTLSIANR